MARTATTLDIIRGPAVVRFKGQCFFTQDGLRIRHAQDITTTEVDCFSDEKSVRDIYAEITLTPLMQWDAPWLAVAYEALTLAPGDSCAALSDELEVLTKSGERILYHCAWISSIASLNPRSGELPAGSMTFKAVRKPDTLWSDPESLFTCSTQPWDPTLATKYDSSLNYKQCFIGCWGATPPWDSFKTLEGFQLDINVNKDPCETDCDGLVDETVQNVEVKVSANVIGIDLKEALNAMPVQGPGVFKGYTPSGPDLTLKGENGLAFIQLKGAAIVETEPGIFGKKIKGGGQFTWQACRPTYPLGYVGTTDPS